MLVMPGHHGFIHRGIEFSSWRTSLRSCAFYDNLYRGALRPDDSSFISGGLWFAKTKIVGEDSVDHWRCDGRNEFPDRNCGMRVHILVLIQ